MKGCLFAGLGLVGAPAALLLAIATLFIAVSSPVADDVSDLARAEIPSALLTVYRDAARTCPGLPWSILAAIGAIESNHGANRVDLTTGATTPEIRGPALDGRHPTVRIPDPSEAGGFARALGPMQFLRTTFDAWARLAPQRPAGSLPDPHNAFDAIFTAAAYLCGTERRVASVADALWRYNQSASYRLAVEAKARDYGWNGELAPVDNRDLGIGLDDDPTGPSPTPRLANAPDRPHHPDSITVAGDIELVVSSALAQLGRPYVYGATGPAAFDCSGLMVWAYRAAGIALPRTTYQQVTVGVEVPLSQARRGDLVFSRGDVPVQDYGHVGMYLGDTTMVVAPKTGDVVKISAVDPSRVQAVRRVIDDAPASRGPRY